MGPSHVDLNKTEEPPSDQVKPKRKKSRLMFDASADEGENTKTEEEQKAHKLLRTRRQSRGVLDVGDISGGLGVPGAGGGGNEDRMRKISEKIAQKVKVENLVRNLKMTELEKFAKNKCESSEP